MLSERLEDRQRMSIATLFQGSLFSNDFFRDSIARLDDWSELDAAALDAFEASVRDVFDGFPIAGSPNESQTEDDLIWPVLEQLGWTASLRQQNLSAHGREDVPARTCGDYPLLAFGELNLYALFVERAMALVKTDGMVGLLTPSGIASDKTAARFFKGVATEGRLRALYDFENKKVFFPDVHASFKFCVFVASPSPVEDPARCAFYLHSVDEIDDSERFRSRMPPLQRRSQDIWVVVHPGADGGPLVGTGRGLTHCSGSVPQKGIDIRTSTARSAGPVLFSRLKASNSNINGSASCERGGRLQAVPQASSRPCPAHRSRL